MKIQIEDESGGIHHQEYNTHTNNSNFLLWNSPLVSTDIVREAKRGFETEYFLRVISVQEMLKTTIGGSIKLDCCIFNASGPRTGSIEALSKIAESKAGAILSKSSTLVKQDGNELPRFVNRVDLGENCQGSMNSEGLPNAGVDYYISEEAIRALSTSGKPYLVSLSGSSLDDNLEMLSRVMDVDGIAGIELNLACPNVPGKPIIAYDFDMMEKWIKKICSHPKFKSKPLGVKMAPYFDAPHFEQAASIVAKYPIKFITCINTIGNALMVDADNEMPSMLAKGGFGGLGGGYVKPTALANVNTMCRLLSEKNRSDIDVVGVGGVGSGRDAFEMILVGAKAVQVGTCHWTEGAGCFERIAHELEDIMKSKGYSNIEDFRGKLKPYSKELAKRRSPTVKSTAFGKNEHFDHSTQLMYLFFHAMFALLCVSVMYFINNGYWNVPLTI